MTAVRVDSPARAVPFLRRRGTLWAGFLGAHLVVAVVAFTASDGVLGDVGRVYRPWALAVVQGGVEAAPGVYPLPALIPMMLPLAAPGPFYGVSWLVLVTAIDAAAFAVLTSRLSGGVRAAAWWWSAFVLLLGPIALTRLDAVTAALAVAAVVVLAGRPALAGVLLAVGAWIKVWPAALALAAVAIVRRRVAVLTAAVSTALAVAVVALAVAGPAFVGAFASTQLGRGLQIEAPVATVWMWWARLGPPHVVFDERLKTFEVVGGGSGTVAAFMTPLMALAVAGVLAAAWWGRRRGAPASRRVAALPLALVAALVVFDQVGSPQYLTWLVAPVVFGLVVCGARFATPAVLVAAAAALTQALYPYLYDGLVHLDPGMLVVLTARNAVSVAVWGWAVLALVRRDGAGQRRRWALSRSAAGSRP